MMLKTYMVGCIVSVALTYCDMKRKIKPQYHIIWSEAVLTVTKRCILSWVWSAPIALALALELMSNLLKNEE